MSPPDQHAVEELFQAALELEPARRGSFLTEACRGDAALREEVLSLLNAYENAGSFFDTPAVDFVPGASGGEDVLPAGSTIGSFRLSRWIGSGGMGTVYEAEQDRPQRTVALKTMRSSMSSRSSLRRFEVEAEILARLNHPSIAQIYEVGMHSRDERNVPYFAMELVRDAETLLSHAEKQELGLRARLELFVRVCDAVHHGHQKGVIHRDLKPSNVLVGADSVPKVIDFGVARCKESGEVLTTVGTDVRRLVGTLQYMSPEAFAGDPHDLDTRSDVYSLGVMLYELLTDRVPHDVGTAALAEAARVVQEEAPTRPSRVRRELRGDLETIMLKALEKDRERRYASASDLALDLQRYLRNETIEARPPSSVYQLRKFVTRHRAASALVALLFVSLIGFGIAMAALAKEARAEATVAERVTQFLEELFASASPARTLGEDVPVSVILEQGRRRIAHELHDQPEVRARLLATLGRTYSWIGRPDETEALLREAIDVLTEASGEGHPLLVHLRVDLGSALGSGLDMREAESLLRGALQELEEAGRTEEQLTSYCRERLAHVLKHVGRDKEAEELFRSAITLNRRRAPLDAKLLADSILGLAILLHEKGRDEEAREHFEEALALYARARPAGHPTVATIRSYYARCLTALGEHEAALAEISAALEESERVLGADNLGNAGKLKAHAHALSSLGRHAEAEQELRRALDLQERYLDGDTPGTAFTCNDLGLTLFMQGRFDEAATFLRRSVRAYRQAFQGDHPHLEIALVNQAEALAGLGEQEEAERTVREGLAMGRRLDPAGPSVGRALNVLSWILILEGRLDEAELAAREALSILEKWPRETTGRGSAHGHFALLFNLRGEAKQAESEARLALASRAENDAGDQLYLAYAHYLFGWARQQLGDGPGAVEAMEESIAMFRRLVPGGHPDVAWPLNHLGEVIVSERPEDAAALFEEALALRRRHGASAHWLGLSLLNLGAANLRLERLEDAEEPLLEALDLLAEHPGEASGLRETVRQLVRLYELWDRPDEAAGFRDELARLGGR